MTQAVSLLCLLFILLVPLAGAGLAVINSGLGRSRNAAHMMLSSLCVFALAAIVFFVIGFAFEGYPGGPAYEFLIRAKPWNWIAADHFFLRGLPLDGSPASLVALLGMMSVGVAAIIPLGSGADRWRLGAACLSTTIFAAWTYPLFAHWVWSGWLAPARIHRRRRRRPHPSRRRYHSVGRHLDPRPPPRQIYFGSHAHGHPRPQRRASDLGCFLVWLGWIGLDCAGAILYAHAEPTRSVLVVANATLSAAAALLAVAAITRIRFGKPDASLCANGWVCGLVASSAGCAVMPPAAAMIVGLVAGALVTYTVELLELHLTIDDPGGSISVHLFGGIWGILAVALLAKSPAPTQWLAQLAGVSTLLGLVLPLTYLLIFLQNRISGMRTAPEGERQGLDLHELGAGAYPDFMTHND